MSFDIFKVVAMSGLTAGGGVGGVFAPSLFMGGVTGFSPQQGGEFLRGRLRIEFVLAGWQV